MLHNSLRLNSSSELYHLLRGGWLIMYMKQSENKRVPLTNHTKHMWALRAITNSDLNRPCFAWHTYGKSGLFKTELVIA